jgi:hypothetical protein
MFRFIALLAILAVAFGGAADSKVSALTVLKTPHDLQDTDNLKICRFYLFDAFFTGLKVMNND